MYLRLGVGRITHVEEYVDGGYFHSYSGLAAVADGSVGIYVSRRIVVHAVVASAFQVSGGQEVASVFLGPGVTFRDIATLPLELDLFLGPALVGVNAYTEGAGYMVGLAFPFAQGSVKLGPWVQWRACVTLTGDEHTEAATTTVLSAGMQLSY